MLTYGLWQRRFGGSREIIGKPITLDSRPYTVVGVLPPGFQLLQPADVFVPFVPWAVTLPDDRNWHPGIIAIARLKPGVSREQARAEMVGITKRLEQQYPDYNTGTSADVVGLQEQLVQNVRPALILLLGAVSLVLLIACVNVANLLLARASSRGREVAIRTAMGAGRGRVVRQLLTESVLLSLGGGLLGIFFAWASLGPLLKISAGSVPQVVPIELDRSVLVFTFVVSLITGLFFGLVPALRTAKLDLRETLNEGSRGSTSGPGHHRLRGVLVASEIALAVLLLVGSGLLLRSFSRLQDVPPGFQADHLLVADIPLIANGLFQARAALPVFRPAGGTRQGSTRCAFGRCSFLLAGERRRIGDSLQHHRAPAEDAARLCGRRLPDRSRRIIWRRWAFLCCAAGC